MDSLKRKLHDKYKDSLNVTGDHVLILRGDKISKKYKLVSLSDDNTLSLICDILGISDKFNPDVVVQTFEDELQISMTTKKAKKDYLIKRNFHFLNDDVTIHERLRDLIEFKFNNLTKEDLV